MNTEHQKSNLTPHRLSWQAAGLCGLMVLMLLQGCSRATDRNTAIANSKTPVLSAREVTRLAARMANDECDRLYGKRPFKPEQHAAVLKSDEYRWGGLDAGAKGGLSALVVCRPDGSQPKVEVFYSTDIHWQTDRLPERTEHEAPEP